MCCDGGKKAGRCMWDYSRSEKTVFEDFKMNPNYIWLLPLGSDFIYHFSNQTEKPTKIFVLEYSLNVMVFEWKGNSHLPQHFLYFLPATTRARLVSSYFLLYGFMGLFWFQYFTLLFLWLKASPPLHLFDCIFYELVFPMVCVIGVIYFYYINLLS